MDGSDCLYCCIWDMANPEFVMSLRNKIVEAARWRKALQCTWQLGLKTKNEEEIIHEASDVSTYSSLCEVVVLVLGIEPEPNLEAVLYQLVSVCLVRV